ncbi:MAG: uroporphyrinogen-III synthase, partial [Myxococcota bacterium]
MSLAGRTVWITRSPEDAERLAAPLVALGARVRFIPCIHRVHHADPRVLAEIWGRVSTFDRVLVGSTSAVEPFLSFPSPPRPAPAACVGAATAERLSASRFAEHFQVAEVADVRRAEGLVRALLDALGAGERLEGRRFLFPRAPEGRRALLTELAARGALVEDLETYRIACLEGPVADRPAPGDILTFMSGRTLDCFLERLGEAEARRCLEASVVGVNGPVAAARAAERG